MKPKGAIFYKSALQVNSYRYNHDYRGGELFDEDDYNRQVVQKCQEEGIEVIGLAEHGSIDLTEKLRKELENANITVFPGFELCSAEKIHIICLFSPDKDTAWLNQILGMLQGRAFDPNKRTDTSALTYLDIAQKTNEAGGITYAAHVEEENGLLKVNDGKGGHPQIWKEEKLVMGVQINQPTIDKLDQKCRSILKNQDPNYKRDRKVAVLNSKDIEKPESLSHELATCWIKMDTPSIEGLRQAFLDGDSRIRLNADKPKDEHSKLLTIGIQSTFFHDKLKLNLNANLNALIGGRGTGKSTLIECMRYGLDLAYHSESAKNRAKELLKENFGDGKIVITVFSSRYNKEYTIDRFYGQPPVVKNSDGSISNLSIKDILPEIEIYGQNEIFEFAEKRENHVRILEKFLPQDSNKIPEIQSKLSDNRKKLLDALEKLDDLENQRNREKQLKERQLALQQLGLDKKFKEQDIYNKEQERILRRSDKEYVDLKEIINQLNTTLDEIDLQYLDENSLSDLINKDILSRLKLVWEEYIKRIRQALEQIKQAGSEFESKSGSITTQWQQKLKIFSEDFEKLIRQLPDTAGRKGSDIAKEFSNISRELAAVQGIANQYEKQEKWKNELFKQRETLIHELDTAVHDRYEQIAKKSRKLNKKELAGKMQIEVRLRGNRNKLKSFLMNLPGIGGKKIQWVDEKGDLTVRQLIQDINAGNEQALRDQYGMTTAIAETLVKLTKEQLLKLEEIVLDESLDIMLNVGTVDKENFKNIQGLSSGQKCTAVLNLLLLESRDPLIIDQPEDNLDNAFIAENIVSELRKQKETRQFVFSTHNANIPVFGDAEWIGVMEVEQGFATIQDEHIGSIDKANLKPMVENILEGGKQAFEMRRLKYNF